jgi:hypothetical protein
MSREEQMNTEEKMSREEIIDKCRKYLYTQKIIDQYMFALTDENWRYICLKIAVSSWDKALILNLLVHHKVSITNISNDINILNYAFSLINGTNIDINKLEIIRLLLDHDATFEEQSMSANNRTALMNMAHRLSRVDNYELFVELIRILDEYRQLDINRTDSNGQTFLMHLCQEQSFYNIKIPFIKLLIDIYGADPSIVDNNGYNALMLVLIPRRITTRMDRSILLNNRDQLVQLFIEMDVDINIVNDNGMNPLFLLYNHRQTVSPEIHSLLCTPQSINNIDTIYNMNALQYLTFQVQIYNPHNTQQRVYLTQILSTFRNKDIDALYNALMYKSIGQRSAFEYIFQCNTSEHKELARRICRKVARVNLLTYIKSIKEKKSKPNNKIQLCFMAMGIKFKNYLGKQIVDKL